MNWHRVDIAPPAILVLPPDAASLDEADAAVELWEHYSGKSLDPAQRLTVQVMMAQAADGRWAASTTGREMPRQNGKGDEIEVVELWGLVQRAEAILHTVHDAVLLATQAQQRLLNVLESQADTRRLLKRTWKGVGQQMVEFKNGGVIWYRTRTGGGGRGVDDVDRLVVDEAQHATEEHLAALSPTLLANANPQLNALGTAGLAAKSEWWWSVRKRAISDSPGAFGYVGHTADRLSFDEEGIVVQEAVDPSDRTLWLAVNPAMAAGRGQGMEFLEEQFLRLGPESFAREHLCVWDPPAEITATDQVIPKEAWDACLDAESSIDGSQMFALEVSEDREWACFAAAGAAGECVHVESVDYRPGTKWCSGRAVELLAKWGGKLGIRKGSPAASLVEQLKKAGLTDEQLVELSTEEHARACGQFYDACVEGHLRHREQAQLDVSLRGAVKRFSADAWVWSPRKSTVDISPLVACTVAAYLFEQAPPPEMAEPEVIVL